MNAAETGWLIENTLGGRAIWWRGIVVCGMAWTTDSNEAIRFSRQQDAERVRDALKNVCGETMATAIVTDHRWCPPATIRPPEIATAEALDTIALLAGTGVARKHSNERTEECPVPDTLEGGWMESDEQLRKRLADC